MQYFAIVQIFFVIVYNFLADLERYYVVQILQITSTEGWELKQAVNVKHHRVGENDEPAIYRINEDLEYSVEIYEWSGSSWEPYVANDVEVQFYMMQNINCFEGLSFIGILVKS
ncbi:putative dolichyl-diphosphooligosaccharide--protein glycotransferase [Helianthus annuus]|nr:putative dolichyl-diphosphooligosaccharide--protein glycotransferase [Helianthus annuus]